MEKEIVSDILEIVKTADGSNTIYNTRIGENYHSKHGALQESTHVFIKSGLAYFLEMQNYPANISILEVGFGTGLNFLLSADFCADRDVAFSYTGIEAYPLSPEIIAKTGYQQYISDSTWTRFTECYKSAFSAPVMLNPNSELQIKGVQLIDFNSFKPFDIIYFDAFGSTSQPEMWKDEIIAHTSHFLKIGGIFVTYAITGNLKRALKALGYKVEKLAGAPGKREMLRALKL